MTSNRICFGPRSRSQSAQRGVVLLISLIVLAVLLAAGVALVRSFDTSLFQAGNLAFRRDLTNQADRVTPLVRNYFTGATQPLSTVGDRSLNRPAVNYSATMLPTNVQGIPTALLSPLNVSLEGAGAINVEDQGVSVGTIRYVIDRMCLSPGDETTLGDRCIGVDYSDRAGSVSGGSTSPLRQVTYRVTVRVDGPRNTQAFFQSTFSL